MENLTFNADILFLEGLKVTPQSSLPAFILLLIIYIFIMVSNIGLTAMICLDRSLHQPMYLLFCNMSINDVFGASTVIPRLLSDIFILTKDRYITYKECVIQAFCSHFHAGTSHSVLMVMAFDRYVAICNPLHYANIMTSNMVLKLTLLAWFLALGSVVILIGLNVRLSRCKRAIFNPFCDNASLFKLSCDNVTINHIYGLGIAVVFLGSSIGSITITYLKITMVCLTSKNRVLNSRALQTCATHLAVYLIMLGSCFAPMVLHRFPKLSDSGKLASILFHVVPPALNAVIYGLQIKEVRQRIIKTLYNNKVSTFIC